MHLPIKRALISCYNKEMLIDLAHALQSFNCEIISTGGTRAFLNECSIDSTDISTITQQSESFGGRIKTLSFEVAAALLFDRVRDQDEAKSLGVEPIDLVVCNFYPPSKLWDREQEHKINWDFIDIGGPTLVRAAAKNCQYVGALTCPDLYPLVIDELKSLKGYLSIDCRYLLMQRAFEYVANYDAALSMGIDNWMKEPSLRLYYKHTQTLRYGENSHQRANLYQKEASSFFGIKSHQGKELSYNNILDIQAALDCIEYFKDQACCVIKHNNPCGIAESKDQSLALQRAFEADPVSAFGSVIAFNKELELKTLSYLNLDAKEKKFVEIIIAPSFSEAAKAKLSSHVNLRVISYDKDHIKSPTEYRFIEGGLLEQDRDIVAYESLKWVSARANEDLSEELICFGLQACRPIRSNAIVVVSEDENGRFLLGMGAGQPNRLKSIELAIERAHETIGALYLGHPAEKDAFINFYMGKALLVSEAFFPFDDNIEICHRLGIRTIVQPGGSRRDSEVIEACNRYGIAMMFTKFRHFKH